MTVYFSHATSFCGAVWDPVRNRLEGVETVAWDHPGHGNGPPMSLPVDWKDFGANVLEVTEPGGIGVGHSMGAAALAMAQAADPDRFTALVLIEPIVFPGPYERRDTPMADVALGRRRLFDDREAVKASFLGRGPFADWDEVALDAYVKCGFVGEGPVELACAPELEADVYRASTAHDTWERFLEIEIPVLLMYGENSDTFTRDQARAQASRFPRAGMEIVAGSGHFLPMENPALIADRVRRLVEVGA